MLVSWPATRPLLPLARLAGRCTALRKEPAAAQRWQQAAAATPPAPSAALADARQQEAQQPQPAQQPTQQQQGPMFLVRNETPVPCTISSGAFLEASPRGEADGVRSLLTRCSLQHAMLGWLQWVRCPCIHRCACCCTLHPCCAGAYTTARTVGGSSVFELGFHIDRLASSARLMMEADAAAAAAAAGGASGGPPPSLPPAAAAVVNPAQLRPRVLAAMPGAAQLQLETTPPNRVSEAISSQIGTKPQWNIEVQL